MTVVNPLVGLPGVNPNDLLVWNGSAWVAQHLGEESLIAPIFYESASRVEFPIPRPYMYSANTLTAGVAFYTYFIPRRTLPPITKLGVYTTTASVGATLARMGLYTVNGSFDVTRVAHTDADATFFAATSPLCERPLSSKNLDGTAGTFPTAYTLQRGQLYAVCMIEVGATTAPIVRGLGGSTEEVFQTPPLCVTQTAQTDIGGGNSVVTPVLFSAMSKTSSCPGGYLSA